MDEIWKPIPGYEGIYEASNLGRIRTAEGKTTYSVRHGERHWKQRILKPKSCSDFRKTGYRVTLWKDKKCKDFLVARLVCTTWHENLIDTGMTVNHKDGDRLNNKIENLEWLSISDNIKHGYENCLYHNQDITILKSEKTGEEYTFRNQVLANKFLGKNHGYINNLKRKGKTKAIGKDGEVFSYKTIKREAN
jgi:hypothetical protein